MAIPQDDGSIILTTSVDTSGIEKGKNDILSISNKTSKSIKNLGVEISKALAEGDTKQAQLLNSLKKATEEVEKQTQKVRELKEKLSNLEAGKLEINDKSVAKLQSDFEKTNVTIEKTKKEITDIYMQLDKLQMNAFKAPDTSEVMLTGQEQKEFDKLNSKLDELEPRLEANKKKAEELGTALKNASGTATQAEIEKTKKQLNDAESKLGNLTTKVDIASQKLDNNLGSTNKKIVSTGDSMNKLGKRILSLTKSALIFSIITKGLTEFRNTIGSALMSNEQFRNSVNVLQASLWTVSYPIYQAILPGLQKLIKWLTIGILYISTFFSAMGGKTLEQTIAGAKALNKQAQAYKNVTKASGELKKQLAAFDELNILQNGKVSSNGINLGGVQSGFDDLESLLNDSDMQNLQNFENWVMQNKDSIETALEIAGLGLLALGIGKVISKIGSLLGWFDKKDKGLDKQTKKTNTETEAVRELSNAWSLAPAFAFALVPALNRLTESGNEFVPTFQTASDVAWGLAPAFDTSKDSAYGLSPALNEVTASAYELSPAFQSATEKVSAFDILTKAVMPSVQTLISTSLLNAKNNVYDFCTSSKANIELWASNMQTNVINTAKVIGENIYNAFETSRSNIKDFINTTSKNFAQWATNMASNMASMASNIATNFGAALSSAWTNFKNFMSATGQKISGFWSEHKATIITVGVLTGLTVAGITLAPYTGGASLALPALAKGAVLPPNKPFLAMVGDQKHGTNIEAPASLIKQMVNEALEERGYVGGQDITIRFEGSLAQLGRVLKPVIDKEGKRKGPKLVTGGAY